MSVQTETNASTSIPSSGTALQRFDANNLAASEEALASDGAVILQGVFSSEMLQNLTREHDKVLVDLDNNMKGLERKEAVYLNGLDDKGNKVYNKQGYWDLADGTKVLDVGSGRLDFTYGLDQGLFLDSNFHTPPGLTELFQRMLKADYTHYVGAVPSRSRSEIGFLHRDTYSLFDDEAIDRSLPPFYFTVLMPLSDVTDELGPTEIHLGSHRCAMAEALVCPKATACPLKAGDVLVFDGRCLHRGLANKTTDLRRVLYSVWHKKWYNDYSEFNFAPGFSVCEPEEPSAKRARTALGGN